MKTTTYRLVRPTHVKSHHVPITRTDIKDSFLNDCNPSSTGTIRENALN